VRGDGGWEGVTVRAVGTRRREEGLTGGRAGGRACQPTVNSNRPPVAPGPRPDALSSPQRLAAAAAAHGAPPPGWGSPRPLRPQPRITHTKTRVKGGSCTVGAQRGPHESQGVACARRRPPARTPAAAKAATSRARPGWGRRAVPRRHRRRGGARVGPRGRTGAWRGRVRGVAAQRWMGWILKCALIKLNT